MYTDLQLDSFCIHEYDLVASYGYPGTMTRLYCNSHKTDSTVNLSRTLCIHEGCTSTATYGHLDTKIRLYCMSHKNKDMVYLNSILCKYEGC